MSHPSNNSSIISGKQPLCSRIYTHKPITINIPSLTYLRTLWKEQLVRHLGIRIVAPQSHKTKPQATIRREDARSAMRKRPTIRASIAHRAVRILPDPGRRSRLRLRRLRGRWRRGHHGASCRLGHRRDFAVGLFDAADEVSVDYAHLPSSFSVFEAENHHAMTVRTSAPA